MDIRRNIYEPNGKDVTPAETNTNGQAAEELEESLTTPKPKFFCHNCGNDCTAVRYHNCRSQPGTQQGKTAADAKYDICPTCFLEAHFPSSAGQEDFVKVVDESHASVLDRDQKWADDETLRLLEALEIWDDNWNEVAKFVGTRTKEQCVLKFLQLDIEDKYLDAEPSPESADNLSYLSGGRLPFSRADNPVMSVVGFLAAAVEPNVAAAAAGKSVEEILKPLREKREQSAKSPAEEKGATEDAMEVDSSTAVAKSKTNPATTALALSAARSAALATHEERHVTSLLSSASNLQMQKLELKMQQFGEMERLLQAERRDLEKRRRDLFLERLAWRRRCNNVRDEILRCTRNGLTNEESINGVVEALGSLGISGEGLELMKVSVEPAAASATEGETNGEAMQQDVPPVEAVLDIKPLTPDEPGFRSHEI